MGNHPWAAQRRLITVFVAAGMLALTVVASPASAEPAAGPPRHPRPEDRAFTRTIEPYYPDHVATTPPVVLPRVTCVRPAGPGRIEAVFGYENSGPVSQFSPIADGIFDPMNQILHQVGGITTVQDQGPQVTEFLPGSHPYGFSLIFPVGEVPTWTFTSPPTDPDESIFLWQVSVTPTFRKTCGSRVPKHFAVVQMARLGLDSTNEVRDPAGNVVSYDLQAEVAAVVTTCSEGGTPQPYDVIYGWSTDDRNLVPLERRDVIKTVRHGIGTLHDSIVQNTLLSTRSVADPSADADVYGPSSDITAACIFPDGSSVRSAPFWADPAMFSTWSLKLQDGLLEVYMVAVAPGGTRVR